VSAFQRFTGARRREIFDREVWSAMSFRTEMGVGIAARRVGNPPVLFQHDGAPLVFYML
jgi:hypothetical protein